MLTDNRMGFKLLLIMILHWHWKATDGGNFTKVWQNISVDNQIDLNQFIENVTKPTNKNNANHLNISLAGDNKYTLDIVRLMSIGVNGSLILKSHVHGKGGPAEISCTVGTLDLEELRRTIKPLSRALLVLLDGLVFSGCPVPILIEEADSITIQNCVFQ